MYTPVKVPWKGPLRVLMASVLDWSFPSQNCVCTYSIPTTIIEPKWPLYASLKFILLHLLEISFCLRTGSLEMDVRVYKTIFIPFNWMLKSINSHSWHIARDTPILTLRQAEMTLKSKHNNSVEWRRKSIESNPLILKPTLNLTSNAAGLDSEAPRSKKKQWTEVKSGDHDSRNGVIRFIHLTCQNWCINCK